MNYFGIRELCSIFGKSFIIGCQSERKIMPVIEIVKAKCDKCGSGRRVIDIKSFAKNFCIITESTLRIWNGKKKCWICKKQPEVDERWSISINNGERNRLYCPACGELIEKKLAAV